MPMLAVAAITIGMKTAPTAVLFTKGAITASTRNRMTRNCVGERARPSRSPMPDSAPLFCSPAARTNMAATVTVAGLLKPLSACTGSTRSARTRLVSTSRATASMRSLSVAKRIIAPRAMSSTSAMSIVMLGKPASSSACPGRPARVAGELQREHDTAIGGTECQGPGAGAGCAARRRGRARGLDRGRPCRRMPGCGPGTIRDGVR